MFFGIETEYALGIEPGGNSNLPAAADRLLGAVMRTQPHLSARPGGVFLGNGSRFYIDSGAHPELATPEVSSPWDAHRYVLAGDRLLRRALQAVVEAGGPQFRLARSNVDYFAGQTWACHENYSYRCDSGQLPPNLTPHLVSRICYGAGGLDPFRPLRFVLSPRVCFLQSQLSGSSTSDRGIFHLKDESLATDGSRRMHVLCGESLCSERASLLRVGTTALVLALTERGHNPGLPLKLREPLAAMRSLNADPTLRRQVNLEDGRALSAIEIQRELLQAVERQLRAGFLPDWAESICQLWRETLDVLARDPAELHSELDWGVKLRLFNEQRSKVGLSADHCAAWDNRIVSQPPLLDAFLATLEPRRSSPVTHLLVTEDEVVTLPQPRSAKHRLPAPAQQVIALRQQLAELDGRFSEFTADREGLFRRLQQAGAIAESVVTDRSIERAVTEPPAEGRAKLRGEFIRSNAGQRQFTLDWGHIRDDQRKQMLVLPGPACDTLPEWQTIQDMDSRPRPDFLSELFVDIERSFNVGDYLGGWQALRDLEASVLLAHLHRSLTYWFLVARLGCRSGHFTEGLRAVARVAELRGDAFNAICTHMVAHRYEGLVAGERMWEWIRVGLDFLATTGEAAPRDNPLRPPAGWQARRTSQSAAPDDVFLFRQQWAHALLLAGRVSEAEALLTSLIEPGRGSNVAHPRIICRAMVDLAECRRRLGAPELARHLLQNAEEGQREVGAVGDIADYTLRVRVKLDPDDAAARAAVAEANAIHQQVRSPMGEARLLLVEARRLPEDARCKNSLQKLRELTASTPALQTCPLRQRIEREWDEVWCARRQPVDKSADDFYWGL